MVLWSQRPCCELCKEEEDLEAADLGDLETAAEELTIEVCRWVFHTLMLATMASVFLLMHVRSVLNSII
jgi:hypothetical protein